MHVYVTDLKQLNLSGKMIAFPTDTIYGMAAMVSDPVAIDRIYEFKGRDESKPLAVLFTEDDSLKDLVDVSDVTWENMNHFWPGAITFIVPKKEGAPFQPEFPTIGIRKPDSRIAEAVIQQFGPMAATSINTSGEESINDLEVIKTLAIDYIILDEEQTRNQASTVVDLANGRVLREGIISKKDLWEKFPHIK